MRNNTGRVAVLMGTIGAFLAVLGLALAVPTTDASPHSPWYCYRLAPQLITSAVTPCTFPCLFISPNVHPHIVVQQEHDGTPCHVAPSLHHKTQVLSSLHHEAEVGRCRRGVCTVKLPPPVLKRKKRFICLITLAALLRAKKDRKKLKEQMANLQRLAWYNSMGGVRRVVGSGVGNGLYSNRRTDSAGRPGANPAVGEDIEIHIIPGGENGVLVGGNSGRGISPPFISGNSAGGSIGNAYIRSGHPGSLGAVTNGPRISSGGYTNLGNGRLGVPGMEDTNAGSSISGRRLGIAGTGFAGRGASASDVGGGGNFALGNGGEAGSLGGNSGLAAGIVGAGIAGNGGRNLDRETNSRASISSVVATTSRGTGGRGDSAAVIGVVGTRTTTRGGGNELIGESGGFRREDADTITRRLVGAGSSVTSRGTPSSNNVDVSSGAIGATIIGGSSGAPGIGGVSSAFSRAVSGVRGRNVRGSTRRADATNFAAGNGMGAYSEGNSYFAPDVDDNDSVNADFDDAEEAERRSSYNSRFRG